MFEHSIILITASRISGAEIRFWLDRLLVGQPRPVTIFQSELASCCQSLSDGITPAQNIAGSISGSLEAFCDL